MKLIDKHQGFSAVELLITLFIAATFLVAGFQLYSTIIKDSGSIRLTVRASNVAYNYLQKTKSDVTKITNPCSPYNFPSETPIIDGLSNVIVNIAITCPYTSASSLSKITVTIDYNGADQPVVQSLFIDGGSV
ncbi:MAG: prepilin-type N-terminal cleavage/methylation domain-containing protein [Candidatus Saccharimonadales bacterium]